MFYGKIEFMSIYLFTVTTLSLWVISIADVPRPRGVALSNAGLYKPILEDSWRCLDKSKTIKFIQINDDYCDCSDGSDEPGTSACVKGIFHCSNKGHYTLDIPSSRVNDGICDCCDGSDEYEQGSCINTCDELGKVEKERRKSQVEMYKIGSAKRSEMAELGKQLRSKWVKQRAELEARLQDLESMKAEKEQLKKEVESAEMEAINSFKQEHKVNDEIATPTEPIQDNLQTEANASFINYDKNKDGFVEVSELQLDLQLDRDRNGVVTVEEARYFLDERDRIDLEAFIALSWPRIKTMRMKAQGLFTPPEDDEQQAAKVSELVNEENIGDQKEDIEQFEDQEEEEEENYEEEDVGTGSIEVEKNHEIEYDPETQRIIDIANNVRNDLTEVENSIRGIKQEIKEIDDKNTRDYGPHDEYATLEGKCYNFEEREYVYKLCLFERASQQPRSGGSEITLGRWDQWLHEGDKKYSKQKYANGASCWNGPHRSVLVHLKCALECKITAVSEPNRCEYSFDFETPAACDEEAAEQHIKDEL